MSEITAKDLVNLASLLHEAKADSIPLHEWFYGKGTKWEDLTPEEQAWIEEFCVAIASQEFMRTKDDSI